MEIQTSYLEFLALNFFSLSHHTSTSLINDKLDLLGFKQEGKKRERKPWPTSSYSDK